MNRLVELGPGLLGKLSMQSEAPRHWRNVSVFQMLAGPLDTMGQVPCPVQAVSRVSATSAWYGMLQIALRLIAIRFRTSIG